MSEEYGSDFITLTDEEGNEFELEILERIEYNGQRYVAATLAGTPDDAEEVEVNILKEVEENGEIFLEGVEDDEEAEAVYNALMDLLYEEDEEE